MSEVAAVSGHVTVKPGAGGAKAGGAGAAASAVSLLDGAFAALLGKAGDADSSGASTFASLLTPDGKGGAAAQAALDPVQVETGLTATDDSGAPVGVCMVDVDPLGQLEDKLGKPAKAKPKAKDDEASPLVFLAAALPAAPTAPTASGKAAKSAEGDGGSIAAVSGTDAVVSASAAAQKGEGSEAVLPAAKTEDSAKQAVAAAPVTDKPAAAKAQPDAPAAANGASAASDRQLADASAQNDDRKGDARERAPESPSRGSAETQSADAGAASIDGTLRSIVQSLPPVLQSQLSVGAASGGGAAPVSTGEQLGNQVIDMSVQGQWIDRMAREIATLADGTGHSRFQLSPPNLGTIQVDLWRNDDRMNLRLVTETDEAARRLNEGKSALEAHARVAALSLGHVSVEKASQSDSARDQGQSQQNRQGAEQSANQGQQQASAQAQGQHAQGRGNGSANRGGISAVIGQDQGTAPEQPVAAARASDPHVRFA